MRAQAYLHAANEQDKVCSSAVHSLRSSPTRRCHPNFAYLHVVVGELVEVEVLRALVVLEVLLVARVSELLRLLRVLDARRELRRNAVRIRCAMAARPQRFTRGDVARCGAAKRDVGGEEKAGRELRRGHRWESEIQENFLQTLEVREANHIVSRKIIKSMAKMSG